MMRGIVKYLALLLAGILAASCIFDADQCVMSSDQSHGIMFTVALDHHRTKATWGDEYPSANGVPFDLRIINEDLSVVVYAIDGTRLGALQDLDYWPINDNHTEFRFIGQLPAEFVEHYNGNPGSSTYKFMVLANCGNNLSMEENITYNQSQLDPSSKDSSIPMWGVKEADVTPLLSSDNLDIGEIWLLRAAAKVEVKLSDEEKSKGTQINSAVLKYYNQTGYCVPTGWADASFTKKLNQENCMRLYRHAAVNLPFYKDAETGSVYVYVTEYDNKNYPEEHNMISLEFNINGENKRFENAISFCKYSEGKPQEDSYYDIVRNHIYEFEILSIAGDNLVLEYTVADWDAERWDSDGDGVLDSDHEEHVLAYPTYHNPVVPARYLSMRSEDINGFSITEKPEMYFSGTDNLEAGAFECFFQITAPEQIEWKPGISGSLEKYRIRVYNHTVGPDNGKLLFDSNDNELTKNLGACAANGWYRIVVFPLSNEGADQNEIDFMITYHQTWTDQYIHLYINGEYDHIRWPESGNNPKIIKIKHVPQPVTYEIEE